MYTYEVFNANERTYKHTAPIDGVIYMYTPESSYKYNYPPPNQRRDMAATMRLSDDDDIAQGKASRTGELMWKNVSPFENFFGMLTGAEENLNEWINNEIENKGFVNPNSSTTPFRQEHLDYFIDKLQRGF